MHPLPLFARVLSRRRLLPAAVLALVVLGWGPAEGSDRVAAISEFSLAFRIAETDDTPPPGSGYTGSSGHGAVLGWEGGVLLAADRPLAWGATLSLAGGQRTATAAARLRLRHRFPGSRHYLDLSPGFTLAVDHDFRAPAGTGFVCGADYGFNDWCAATLQFERLPMEGGPPHALTNLNLGLKVGGRAGAITGGVVMLAGVVAVLMLASAFSGATSGW